MPPRAARRVRAQSRNTRCKEAWPETPKGHANACPMRIRLPRKPCSRRELSGQGSAQRAFEFEELAFNVEAAAVPAERAVRSDHAVTRQNDGDRVSVVGHAHRTKGLRLADRPCDIRIRARFAGWGFEQGMPATQLKRGSAQVERKAEFTAFAGKVVGEFPRVRFCFPFRKFPREIFVARGRKLPSLEF